MHWFSSVLFLAQASPDDVAREIARLQRNFEFLGYGFWAAWAVLIVFVLTMVSRERRLKRQIASLRAMLEERQKK
jgi:hypothetical protein